MNTLSFQSSSDNGLSFELFVDDKRLGDLIGDGNEGIPYWIIEDDLPSWPPHGEPRQEKVRIISVCSCGEYGCGHTRCSVEIKADSVVFSKFAGDIKDGEQWVFVFPRQNYCEVVSKIVQRASEQRNVDSMK